MSVNTIKIENCNSIEKAEIALTQGTLNIKYGPNGLGKSTIARAIFAKVANDGSLQSLKPFKYRDLTGKHEPAVLGTEGIDSVLVFDDSYVSQFVFRPDEVLKNSFDIFIKTDEFLSMMKEIEELFTGIKSTFDKSEVLTNAISDLKEVRDAFVFTKSGSISKASKGFKAYGSGNKIENIPIQLKPFEEFIKSAQPASWIAWQAKGNVFLDLSDNCPYCSSSLQEPEKKEMARQVAKEYDSKAVEYLNALQTVISRLGRYFEQSCRMSLEKITRSKIQLTPEEINFLSALRGDVETLIAKLEGLRSISFFALRDVDKIEDEVTKLEIDLSLLAKLNSTETQSIVKPINENLRLLINRVGDLKGKINRHKDHIKNSIIENQNSINGFLRSAGYKYSVRIEPEAESYKMKLVHKDFNEHIETATQHLSFGEKNAFALVLFMHQVIREKPSLAILDDPVSSFDKTKKFAILNTLFRGKPSLRTTTVLMLTHDIEPAIDIIRGVKGLFQNPKPTANFLVSRAGIVSETVIKESDIQTFAQICTMNVRDLSDDVIKCIYLRRHFEILNNLGEEYNLLANLLHAREVPVLKTESGTEDMSAEDIAKAVSEIKILFPNFNYGALLAIIKDKSEMKRRFQNATIGYEKLQLFRLYKDVHKLQGSENDNILQKFLNETFHIENEYVMQLNPQRFENVPEYIIQECEHMMLES